MSRACSSRPRPADELAPEAELIVADVRDRAAARAGDPTNWWAPNHACAMAMKRSCGFAVEARPVPEISVCRPGAAPPATRQLRELLSGLMGDRPR